MNALAVRILAGLAFVVLMAGAHLADKHRAAGQAFKAGQAEVSGRWAAEKSTALATAFKAQQDRDAEAWRRIESNREIDRVHELNSKARADVAASSGVAVGRLRERLAAFAAFAAGAAGPELPGDPAAAVDRQALATLRDVLDDSAERHRALGLEADAAAAAADECAARYDALTPPKRATHD